MPYLGREKRDGKIYDLFWNDRSDKIIYVLVA